MTNVQEAAAQLGEIPEPVEVEAHVAPEPDSRLEQLLAQYDMAKAESEKAAEALKAITDGIKAELTKAAPGATKIDVASPLLARPLRLNAVTSWRVKTDRLKQNFPLAYASCAEQSTSYRLASVGR